MLVYTYPRGKFVGILGGSGTQLGFAATPRDMSLWRAVGPWVRILLLTSIHMRAAGSQRSAFLELQVAALLIQPPAT